MCRHSEEHSDQESLLSQSVLAAIEIPRFARNDVLPWQGAAQQFAEFCGGHAQANEKRSEERILGTHFVEAHFVDQLLENQRVIREQVYAPLPIVEAN